MEKVHFDALGDTLINGKRPTFDNPNGWTQDDMARWFELHMERFIMGWNIRCMALNHHMKNYTPTTDPLLTESNND